MYVPWYRWSYRVRCIGVGTAPCSLCTECCCLLLVIDYAIRCRQYHDVWRIQGEWVRNPNFPWDLLDDSLGLGVIISVTGERTYVGRSSDPGGEACRLRDVGPSWGGDARLRKASDVRVRVPTLSGMRVSRLSSNLELSVPRTVVRGVVRLSFARSSSYWLSLY